MPGPRTYMGRVVILQGKRISSIDTHPRETAPCERTVCRLLVSILQYNTVAYILDVYGVETGVSFRF